MSDFGGYTGLSHQRPDQWLIDGYAQVTDGYGTIAYAGTVPFQTDAVKSITRTGVGAYTLTLSQAPVALVGCDVKSIIPSTLSPAYVGCQLVSSTVGQASAGANPVVKWQFNVGGTPTELPQGSGFLFMLLLTES